MSSQFQLTAGDEKVFVGIYDDHDDGALRYAMVRRCCDKTTINYIGLDYQVCT